MPTFAIITRERPPNRKFKTRWLLAFMGESRQGRNKTTQIQVPWDEEADEYINHQRAAVKLAKKHDLFRNHPNRYLAGGWLPQADKMAWVFAE